MSVIKIYNEMIDQGVLPEHVLALVENHISALDDLYPVVFNKEVGDAVYELEMFRLELNYLIAKLD